MRTLADLPDPTHTSVSIITNPKVRCADTISRVFSRPHASAEDHPRAIGTGKSPRHSAVWLQPGAEDEAVISYIKENGLEGKAIYGGPCVLVEGDTVLQSLL